MSGPPLSTIFVPMAGERRMISDSIVAATNAVFNNIPATHNTAVIGAVDTRRGHPTAVLMVGRRIGEHVRVSYVFTGSAAEGLTHTITGVASW